jgi:hypothetical protein
MDAAPQMAALGHVTGLARSVLSRVAACPPLFVGVLEQLAVQRIAIGLELVAAAAEGGFLECTFGRESVVRKLAADLAGDLRSTEAWRTEATVLTDVAAGTAQAFILQIRIEVRVLHEKKVRRAW